MSPQGEINHTYGMRTRKSPVDGSWACWIHSPTGATLAEGSGTDESRAINAAFAQLPNGKRPITMQDQMGEARHLEEQAEARGAEVEMATADGLGADPDPLAELRRECGYSDDPGDDAGVEVGVDALIAYKDALEDRCGSLEVERDRLDPALTQCQHIAYEAMVGLEGSLSVPAGRLKAEVLRGLALGALKALRRVNSIAEGGAADPEFVAMLKAADKESES